MLPAQLLIKGKGQHLWIMVWEMFWRRHIWMHSTRKKHTISDASQTDSLCSPCSCTTRRWYWRSGEEEAVGPLYLWGIHSSIHYHQYWIPWIMKSAGEVVGGLCGTAIAYLKALCMASWINGLLDWKCLPVMFGRSSEDSGHGLGIWVYSNPQIPSQQIRKSHYTYIASSSGSANVLQGGHHQMDLSPYLTDTHGKSVTHSLEPLLNNQVLFLQIFN